MIPTRTLTLPELGLIAGTRGALGAGLGLLLADRMSPQRRRAIGWTLFAVGLLSTIPLGALVIWGGRHTSGNGAGRAAARKPAEQFAAQESP